MLNNIYFDLSRHVLWVVLEWLIVVSSYSKHILWAINIIAEVNIVHFINITHIHVVLKDDVHDVIWSLDTKLC